MNTAILSIIKGTPRPPSTTNLAENEVVALDFLDAAHGFALSTEDGYVMGRPSLKSSSVWSDTPLSPGRRLIAGEVGNVTEVIKLTVQAPSNEQLAAHLTQLERMIADCRYFWTTNFQRDPVQIKHQVVGEPGPRYALLFNIDMEVTPPDTINSPTRDITLSIEREAGWSPIPRGQNPKQWVYDERSVPMASRNYAISSTDGGSSVLTNVYNTTNMHSVFPGGSPTICRAAYIDIPAEDIPGDLDADLMLKIQTRFIGGATTYYVQDVYMGRWTRAFSLQQNVSTLMRHTNILQVYDGNGGTANIGTTLGTDATLQSDAGVYSDYVNPNPGSEPCNSVGSRLRVTFATATDQIRFTYTLNTNLFSGRYMAFIRGHQSGGALGDERVYLQYGIQGFETSTTEVIPPLQTVAAGTPPRTAFWPLMYMGVIDVSAGENRVVGSDDGDGLHDLAGFTLNVRARRPTGSSEFYMADLVLIPIDEAASVISAANAIAGMGSNYATLEYTYDTTAYYSHGVPDAIVGDFGGGRAGVKQLEYRGQPIRLKPGVDNRIYFLFTADDSGTPAANLCPINPSASGDFRLSVAAYVLPRWAGLRDT